MKQREDLTFDTRFFSRLSKSIDEFSIEERFNYIYKNNFWIGQSSVSGQGSDESQTEEIRASLPELILEYKIERMLDLPCGDFNWMKNIELNLSEYIGADIVQEIIQLNTAKYSNDKRRFMKLDIMKDDLPKVDLIFCRDCLVHLSNDNVRKSIENIKRSNSKYLLTTTFTECEINEDIVTGDWRIINLTKEPFNFPAQALIIRENCTEGNHTYSDKSLGLWRISDL